MIDLALYRARIGNFAFLSQLGGKCQNRVRDMDQVMYLSGYTLLYLFYMLFITYLAPILLSFTFIYSQFGVNSHSHTVNLVYPMFQNSGVILPHIADTHVKVAFVLLFGYLVTKVIIKRYKCNDYPLQNDNSNTSCIKDDLLTLAFGKFTSST